MTETNVLEHAIALFDELDRVGGESLIIMPVEKGTDDPAGGIFVISRRHVQAVCEYVKSLNDPDVDLISGTFAIAPDGDVERLPNRGWFRHYTGEDE